MDKMTREEAIADIRDNIKPVVGGKSLDMAIEALEQEPCTDAIRRQEMRLIDANALKKDLTRFYDNEVTAKQLIDEQPTIRQDPCGDAISRQSENPNKWIPVRERLPELNKPLLVTAYHRVYYGHLISKDGNFGYPVFRIHGLDEKNRNWVQETMSLEPYSLGRIDAWMYFNIPEPYKASPTGAESEVQNEDSN